MSSLDNFRPRLATDIPFYARHCLKIQTKKGELTPLVFNKAQLYIHDRIEQQKLKTGKVRALIIKGRQRGISTDVEAREFHNVTHETGRKCLILIHHDDSTQSLFNMGCIFDKYLPGALKL